MFERLDSTTSNSSSCPPNSSAFSLFVMLAVSQRATCMRCVLRVPNARQNQTNKRDRSKDCRCSWLVDDEVKSTTSNFISSKINISTIKTPPIISQETESDSFILVPNFIPPPSSPLESSNGERDTVVFDCSTSLFFHFLPFLPL
jgi:hypothetical protein